MGYPEAQYVIDVISDQLEELDVDINDVKSKTSNHGYIIKNTKGSTNWICPKGIGKVFVILVGAGGGGGGGGGGTSGGYNPGHAACSGAGGGSGGAVAAIVPVTPGTTYKIVCGAGGSGGSKGVGPTSSGGPTNGTKGGNGSTTSFGSIEVTGGIGGSFGYSASSMKDTGPVGGKAGNITIDNKSVILAMIDGVDGDDGSPYKYQDTSNTIGGNGGITKKNIPYLYQITSTGGNGGSGGRGGYGSVSGGSGSDGGKGSEGFVLLIW